MSLQNFSKLFCSITILLSFISSAVYAEEIKFSMKSASKYADDTADLKIIGGIKADVSEWPATFVFKSIGGGGCTSTAVGPKTIITAAHCIEHKAKGTVEIANDVIPVRCFHHPDYVSSISSTDPDWEEKASPDFALCTTENEIKGIEFENLNKDVSLVTDKPTVLLLGFGCNSIGGSDGGFGVLYEGEAAIQSLPKGSSYYLRTLGGAAVCYGDSGGLDYIFLNESSRTRRIAIGVSSRGDISTKSLISATHVEGFLNWANKFAKENDSPICGLDEQVQGCAPF